MNFERKYVRLKYFKWPSRKTSILLATGFLTLSVLLTWHWRRRRKLAYDDIYADDDNKTPKKISGSGDLVNQARINRPHRNVSTSHLNGGLTKQRAAQFSTPKSTRSNSALDLETLDSVSLATLTPAVSVKGMSAEQLSEMGLEALNNAIRYWEDALDRVEEANEHGNLDAAGHGLHTQLRQMLQQAHRLQEMFEERFFQRVNAGIAMDAALLEMNREYDEKRRRANSSQSIDESSTDQDSFYSAYETADLSDLEEQRETFHYLGLYYSALSEVEQSAIPCRVLRTKLVGCVSDSEYLAKLACVRHAFAEIFESIDNRNWFIDSGRKMLAQILLKADRDTEDFFATYDSLVEYVQNPSNWSIIEDELHGRGVKVMNFFDIALDFVLFDAFDDLDSPPISIVTVMQNKWLSNGFKETALSTAVWSVLKAKRRLLKYPNGFIGHFYTMSEHTSPPLVWGFLGPPSRLKTVCNFFKEQSVSFCRDIFNFNRVRFTTVSELANDILQVAHERFQETLTQLAAM